MLDRYFKEFFNPLTPKICLLILSSSYNTVISFWISYKNLVFNQDNNFYLIHLNILITNLLDYKYMDIIGRSYLWITSGS